MQNERRAFLIELSGNLAKAKAAGKKLTLDQLDKLIDGLSSARKIVAEEEALRVAEEEAKRSAATEVIELMQLSGLTVEDLEVVKKTPTRKDVEKVAPKYRIVIDGQTHEWTGRGRTPKAFERYFKEKGVTKEETLI
jgi:DNA-binding protein H-NS